MRLDLGYDGSGFAGWARQPGRRTVQEELATALATVLRLPGAPEPIAAGRTDAGVHARGQVAHVDVPPAAWEALSGRSGHDPGESLARRLAGVLPLDLRVFRATPAPPGFDARFSARSRSYAYRICDAAAGVDPLRRHEVLWYPRPLDLAAMQAASAPLLGEHDFAAYCRPRAGTTTVRRLLRLQWRRGDALLGAPLGAPLGADIVVATIEADAFCHNMVRALVGALVAVGTGRRPVTWPADVLAARRRDPAVTVVAPHGLTLEAVSYPPDDQLAHRAEQARRLRT